MWHELITSLAPDAKLGEPADPAALDAVRATLGQPLPTELAALLTACDGVSRGGLDVVWDAERIAEENAAFRADPDFAELYMPFTPLMFFGANAGGDQFAFVRTPERDEVFVWDHETDSRYLAAYGLDQYLRRALTEEGDWYR